MNAELVVVHEDTIRQALLDHDLCRPRDSIAVQTLSVNSARRDYSHKSTHVVWLRGRPLIHLTIGPTLRTVYDRATSFHAACPQITCKPFFHTERNGLHYLGQEYFSGKTLDALLSRNEISVASAKRALVRLEKGMLEGRPKPTVEMALQELDELEREICRIESFSQNDLLILRELAFPELRNRLSPQLIQGGWTNGDFISRNIIINPAGRAKLVDYEFAGPTAFLRDSWLRFRRYSQLPPDLIQFADRRIGADQLWLDLRFWLQQIVLEYRTNQPHVFHRQLGSNIAEINRLLNTHELLGRSSIFISEIFSAEHARNGTGETLRKLQKEASGWQERATQLEKDVIELRQQLEAADRERFRASDALSRAEAQVASGSDALGNLQAEHQSHLAEKESLRQQLQEQRHAHAEISSELERVLTEFHRLHEERGQLQQQLDLKEGLAASLQVQCQKLETCKTELEAAYQRIQLERDQDRESLRSLLERETARAAEEGTRASELEVARHRIIELEAGAQSSQQQLAALRSELDRLESLRGALATKLEEHLASKEELREEQERLLGEFTARDTSHRSKIEELEAIISAAAVEHRAVAAELLARQKERDELADLLASRTAWAQDLDRELGRTQKAFQEVRVECDEMRRQLDERTAWAQQLDGELTVVRKQHEEAAQTAEGLRAQANEHEASLRRLHEELQDAGQVRERLLREADALRIANDDWARQCEDARTETAQLRLANTELARQNVAHTATAEACEKSLRESVQEFSAKAGELHVALAHRDHALKETESRVAALQAQLQIAEGQAAQRAAELQLLESQLADERKVRSETETRCVALVGIEKRNAELEEALARAAAESAQHIERLRMLEAELDGERSAHAEECSGLIAKLAGSAAASAHHAEQLRSLQAELEEERRARTEAGAALTTELARLESERLTIIERANSQKTQSEGELDSSRRQLQQETERHATTSAELAQVRLQSNETIAALREELQRASDAMNDVSRALAEEVEARRAAEKDAHRVEADFAHLSAEIAERQHAWQHEYNRLGEDLKRSHESHAEAERQLVRAQDELKQYLDEGQRAIQWASELHQDLERTRVILRDAERRSAENEQRVQERDATIRTLQRDLEVAAASHRLGESQLSEAQEELRRILEEGERAVGWAHSLQTELEQLLAVQAATRQEVQECHTRISGLTLQLAQATDRATRMQATLSWRVTMPLRAIRRQLIDPVCRTTT